MSCSPIVLKDYVLKELGDAERRAVDAHLKSCTGCREELERLRLTEAALFSLREEEIPQRIAFVSDPVFEPSTWQRVWSGFWGSAARLGFASAALLSGAIVYSAVTRPAPVAVTPAAPAVPTIANVQPAPAVSEAEIQNRIDVAVRKAVAASREQEMVQVRQLVGDLQQKRQQFTLALAQLEVDEHKLSDLRHSGYYPTSASVREQQ
ncbi:MAG TPA: zf-HC2 domain-containing protein [Bryobacteraceae bacterium]|nr:zf-HC2 domain-containing protein [Bryobacteraceae bacterium]